MQTVRPTLRGLLAALLTTVFLLTCPLLAMAEDVAAVASANTYIYKSAKTSAKKAKVKKGTAVTVISTNGKWAKVKINKTAGYMIKSKLKTQAGTENPADAEFTGDEQPVDDESDAVTLQPGDMGDAVKKLQTRLKALNWFHGTIGGNYQNLTTNAVREFQAAGKLDVTGVANAATQKLLYSSKAPRLDLSDISTAQPASGAVKEMDWWQSDISSIFARGGYAVVTDVVTGISFRVYRGGGTNHADVQPATAADTAAMKKCYGGSWSWNRRAIWVSIGGNRYAASMNGMPHGSGSISGNDFNGHFCIHFTNSRTHGSNKIDPQHQAAIQQALQAR